MLMAKKEKKVLEKKNWANTFMLIGEAKINDYTYKLDEKSEKSDWIYNSLNLGVYCGETCGTVYAELMGGYGAERDNVVYVHGKKEDGSDDFENKFTIDWDDRFDEDILESIGDLCFMTVGLEKNDKEKVFYKKFLTPYDMIAYINENLEDGMIVNVKGNLKYSTYNDETQVKKEINSVVLSKVDDKSKYCAKFTQTMLLTKDSVGQPDKEKGIIPIYAKVLDYLKEYKGKLVKCNIPYSKTFEYEVDFTNKELVQKVVAKVFKVQKGVTEITFEGDLIEGGATVMATEDDIPDDIKALIDLEVYTLEEALAKCTVNGGRAKRMVIRKPQIKMVTGKDETQTPVLQKFDKKYEEEDLILDFMIGEDEEGEETPPFDADESTEVAEDEDWLSKL
jgi:hypothetical protein